MKNPQKSLISAHRAKIFTPLIGKTANLYETGYTAGSWKKINIKIWGTISV